MEWWVDNFSAYLYGVKVIAMGLAILLLLSGIDDLFIDVVYWFRRIWPDGSADRHPPYLGYTALSQRPEKPLAILVPAWNQTGEAGKMASLAAATLDYENYHIFVGTYANDLNTQYDMDEVCARFPNVHNVVCTRQGTPHKADCLNNILDAILLFERHACFRFSGFILHDVGDAIAPFELRLFNYLIDRKDLIQIPVYPPERGWADVTRQSYLDTLSEWYGKDVPVREALTGQVPSVGSGTCLSRRAVLALQADGDGMAFDEQSLAEDYGIGYRLRQKGMTAIFCRSQVVDDSTPAVRPLGTRRRISSVVCMREYFPDNFGAVVQQRSRWIVSTVCRSVKMYCGSTRWILTYFRWRDRKSGFVTLLGFGAMLVALQLAGLWVYQHTVDDAWQFMPIFGHGDGLTALLWFNLVLVANRIAQRIIFVSGDDGLWQGLMSVPRLFWVWLIHFMATSLALRHVMLHGCSCPEAGGKTPRHLSRVAARSPARLPLGEILLARGIISRAQHKEAMQHRVPGLKLGGSLVKRGVINTLQLAQALAEQAGVPMERIDCRCLDKRLMTRLSSGMARHYAVLPLREEPDYLVLASESALDPVSLAALARKLRKPVRYVIVPRGEVVVGLRHGYGVAHKNEKFSLLARAAALGMLSPQKAEAIWHEYVAGQILFAEVLIAENHLDETVLKAALLRHEHSEIPFGEFLVQERVVDQRMVDYALAQQKKLQPSLNGLLHHAGLSRLQISSLVGEVA